MIMLLHFLVPSVCVMEPAVQNFSFALYLTTEIQCLTFKQVLSVILYVWNLHNVYQIKRLFS